jgi:hypothetical protein
MKNAGQSNTKDGEVGPVEGFVEVRFGSLADIAACAVNVCFTPKSGHQDLASYVPRNSSGSLALVGVQESIREDAIILPFLHIATPSCCQTRFAYAIADR